MHKIVVIKRYGPLSLFWPNLLGRKQLPELSVEELLIQYQGFEGELVSNDLAGSQKYSETSDHLVLHVVSGPDTLSSLEAASIECVGYDVGVCEDEKTLYSSIFNEILFGQLDVLLTYKKALNGHLLFPNRSVAEEYIELHDGLAQAGEDVEGYEKMSMYEIWRKRPLREHFNGNGD